MVAHKLPQHGTPEPQIWSELTELENGDVNWRNGRLPGFFTHFATSDVERIGKEALQKFYSTNCLGPGAFPSIRRFENDVANWSLDLFHARAGHASITSGGTESIFLALKTAREWAFATRSGLTRPKIVLSHSAHPSFDKAAKYLSLEVVRVPTRGDFRIDKKAFEKEIDNQTVLIAGSAPQFTVGVFDQIEWLGTIAIERNLWLHVDACVGGFFSPFAEMVGHPIPRWDFRVPGVKSISADLHKYGFTPKGASIMALADKTLLDYLRFDFSNWSRGRYFTETFSGTKSGGPIAAAWAVLKFLGVDGYCQIVRDIWTVREKILSRINESNELFIYGSPEIAVMSYGAKTTSIEDIGRGLATRGWYTVAPSPNPPAINLGIISLAFGSVVDEYLDDLDGVVNDIISGKNNYSAGEFGNYGD